MILMVPFEVKFVSEKPAMFEEENFVKFTFPELFLIIAGLNRRRINTDFKCTDVSLMFIPTIFRRTIFELLILFSKSFIYAGRLASCDITNFAYRVPLIMCFK